MVFFPAFFVPDIVLYSVVVSSYPNFGMGKCLLMLSGKNKGNLLHIDCCGLPFVLHVEIMRKMIRYFLVITS